MKALLIESPVANLASMRGALMEAGAEVDVSGDPARVERAERIVLPGVGSFPAAARWLEESGIAAALRRAAANGAAILGVCLGHQLLFETSEEGETSEAGVALLEGEVTKLSDRLPLPLVGWGRVVFAADPLFAGISSPAEFYFVHSFRAAPANAEDVIATASYGERYPAAVRRGRICGVQFHPEKSSAAGLRLLSNFLERI
ncbi:MAG TPA: imidazole glycerol phosphate synthase subunit HisH [Thermoanaerobaculia bacterium]|nr:imidazole glycerol phosphate synthase subunit HisH [Thermoanaerobaculia bacterium]